MYLRHDTTWGWPKSIFLVSAVSLTPKKAILTVVVNAVSLRIGTYMQNSFNQGYTVGEVD
jgi:hypothetical protein